MIRADKDLLFILRCFVPRQARRRSTVSRQTYDHDHRQPMDDPLRRWMLLASQRHLLSSPSPSQKTNNSEIRNGPNNLQKVNHYIQLERCMTKGAAIWTDRPVHLLTER